MKSARYFHTFYSNVLPADIWTPASLLPPSSPIRHRSSHSAFRDRVEIRNSIRAVFFAFSRRRVRTTARRDKMQKKREEKIRKILSSSHDVRREVSYFIVIIAVKVLACNWIDNISANSKRRKRNDRLRIVYMHRRIIASTIADDVRLSNA